MEIDLLDRRIISALNSDPLAPFSLVAKRVGSSKEVVNYRVSRLLKEEVIGGFITIFDFGYVPYALAIQLKGVSSKKEDEIFKFLLESPDTHWITQTMGNYDLVWVAMAKTPQEFDCIFNKMMNQIQEYVFDYKFAISIESTQYGHRYLGIETEDRPEKFLGNNPESFDEKDRQIAKCIWRNARMKLTEISQKTGLPTDTIHYRIKRMEEKGIIKRYRLIIDSTKLEYNAYEIFVKTNRAEENGKAVAEKFVEFARKEKNVEFLSKNIGNWDFEITAHFKSAKELKKFTSRLKQEFRADIKSLEVLTLFETNHPGFTPKEFE